MSTDETLPPLPARLQNIVEDFALCEGKEKLELLLQFSEQLPPLPRALKRPLTQGPAQAFRALRTSAVPRISSVSPAVAATQSPTRILP